MADMIDPRHEAVIEHAFQRACIVLDMRGFEIKPLRRRVRGVGKLRSFALGYTKLGTKSVTIDYYTPHTMKPRRVDSILRVICHELAHHQSPPILVRVGWRKVQRLIHHPAFWVQYKKNVQTLAEDEMCGRYFQQ